MRSRYLLFSFDAAHMATKVYIGDKLIKSWEQDVVVVYASLCICLSKLENFFFRFLMNLGHNYTLNKNICNLL